MEIVDGGVVPSSKLVIMLKDSNIDVADIPLDKATEQYEKGRKLEWKSCLRHKPPHKSPKNRQNQQAISINLTKKERTN